MVAIREEEEHQSVKCCFSCPRRVAAKHPQEGNVKSDICMCVASTMFALRRQNHTKQDSKGEIQQDSLLYCHGNPTLMKSRKTIKYRWKKKVCAMNTFWVVERGTHEKSMTFLPFDDAFEQSQGCCFWEMLVAKAFHLLNYLIHPDAKFRFICESCSFRWTSLVLLQRSKHYYCHSPWCLLTIFGHHSLHKVCVQ